MKLFLSLCLLVLAAPLWATSPSAYEVIERARARLGTEAALDALVTLQLTGGIEPAESKLPAATVLVIARKPLSQRLEVRMDDIVETTILNGDEGCVVRTNLNVEGSQMRRLTASELQRVAFNTRQLFSFYEPDVENGEHVRYEGIEQHRGVRCHKLLYAYPDGITTTRYFSVNDDRLVASLSDTGVETVEVGEQTIGGIRFPKRVESYEDNQMLHTLVLSNVAVNKPLPAGIFAIPKGQ